MSDDPYCEHYESDDPGLDAECAEWYAAQVDRATDEIALTACAWDSLAERLQQAAYEAAREVLDEAPHCASGENVWIAFDDATFERARRAAEFATQRARRPRVVTSRHRRLASQRGRRSARRASVRHGTAPPGSPASPPDDDGEIDPPQPACVRRWAA